MRTPTRHILFFVLGLCCTALIAGGSVAFGQGLQAAPAPSPLPSGAPQPLREPGIAISPDEFRPLDEILYIEGRSQPNAIVQILLQKQGEKPVKFTVRADSTGEWVIAQKTYLPAGDWEIRARAQIQDQISDWSNPRIVRSVVTGMDIFGLKVRYVVIGTVAFLFLLVVGVILIYFKRKINTLKRGLFERQLHETEDRVHQSFAEIRRDLTEQLKTLMQNADKRPLTPEEVEHQEHLLRELENIERSTERDIGDIGKKY